MREADIAPRERLAQGRGDMRHCDSGVAFKRGQGDLRALRLAALPRLRLAGPQRVERREKRADHGFGFRHDVAVDAGQAHVVHAPAFVRMLIDRDADDLARVGAWSP